MLGDGGARGDVGVEQRLVLLVVQAAADDDDVGGLEAKRRAQLQAALDAAARAA